MRGVQISQHFTAADCHYSTLSNIDSEIFKFKKQAFKIIYFKIQEKKPMLTYMLTPRPTIYVCVNIYVNTLLLLI